MHRSDLTSDREQSGSIETWRLFGKIGRLSAAVAFLFSLILSGAASQLNPSIKIQGKVTTKSGTPVPNAKVRLEHAGNRLGETTTRGEGLFSFDGLVIGDYTVIVQTSEHHGTSKDIHLTGPETLQLDLILPDTEPAAEAMEFADDPKFSVAAVTDWTAAGGHGSDAVLRTSEALNQETVALKPASSRIAETTAEWKKEESALRAARTSAPEAFAPNHALGNFYLGAERFDEALPLLEIAAKYNPHDFSNEYDLALALKGSGRFAEAREHVRSLAARRQSPDLHRLGAELDEGLGDPLAAVHEFELAAQADRSERNYFEWGSELLLHRAVLQARDVFAAGVKLYPKSERMLTALGAALFAGALYNEAAQRLCEASDLNPEDPEPYRFMGKIGISAPDPLPCIEQKLARFAAQQPTDPLANYYYAMALWKQNGQVVNSPAFSRVENLLNKAVENDPQCSDAWLQMGVLETKRNDYQKAIEFYTKAIDANPQMSEAHYRLGIAYDRIGKREQAAEQLSFHDKLQQQQAAAVERERREVKQFLIVVDNKKSNPNP